MNTFYYLPLSLYLSHSLEFETACAWGAVWVGHASAKSATIKYRADRENHVNAYVASQRINDASKMT